LPGVLERDPDRGPAVRLLHRGGRGLGRRVANGLDVVAVEVVDEGCVVGGGVLRPWTGRAVVDAARVERRLVEGVDGAPVLRREGDVRSRAVRLALHDPELGLRLCAESAGMTLELHHDAVAERRERTLVEGAAPG